MSHNLENIGGIVLNLDYWDCECKTHYIYYKTVRVCNRCNALKEDQPNSRQTEVQNNICKL